MDQISSAWEYQEDFNVLSNEAPIFVDFQFLTKREEKLSQVAWYTTEPFSTTIPTTPEFEQLGLTIQDSDQGDFFEIFGTYNGIEYLVIYKLFS